MIAICQDEEGLRMAAAEMFEETLAREAIGEEAREFRTLSPGYYSWLGFIAEMVDAPLQAGVAIREETLTSDELLGIGVLRDARAEFRRKHPPCRGCGKALTGEREQLCLACKMKLKGK